MPNLDSQWAGLRITADTASMSEAQILRPIVFLYTKGAVCLISLYWGWVSDILLLF